MNTNVIFKKKKSEISNLSLSKLPSQTKNRYKGNGTRKHSEGGRCPHKTIPLPCSFSCRISVNYFIPFISPREVSTSSFQAPLFLIFLTDWTSPWATDRWKPVAPTCPHLPPLGLCLQFPQSIFYPTPWFVNQLPTSGPWPHFPSVSRESLDLGWDFPGKGHLQEPSHTPLRTHASRKEVITLGSNSDQWGMTASG